MVWTGKVAQAYVGDYEFKHDFEVVGTIPIVDSAEENRPCAAVASGCAANAEAVDTELSGDRRVRAFLRLSLCESDREALHFRGTHGRDLGGRSPRKSMAWALNFVSITGMLSRESRWEDVLPESVP